MSSQHALTVFHFSPTTKEFTQKTSHRTLHSHEVLIKTTHSGLCYTDVHAKAKACGLGHEGVGIVERTGDAVSASHIAVGDRVGWGWLHSSCGHCAACRKGYRQYCAEAQGFAFSDLDQGAFGDYRIIDAEFAYRIPHGVQSVHAAPLMCAGASVYEALDAAGTKPADRVGVVGVGGLGHMAILFARAMGCAVSALSSSPRLPSDQKLEDAVAMGADEFYSVAEGYVRAYYHHGGDNWVQEEGIRPWKKIDVLLVTSNELPNWDRVLGLLRPMARIVLMSITNEPLTIPYMPFILPGHRIISSTEASKQNHIDMLEFAARNKLQPIVERFPMTEAGLDAAFARLESGQMRYRGVLEW